jgi:hypothetical protein
MADSSSIAHRGTARNRDMADREGFEPSIGALVPYNGLANRRLQPLGHLPVGALTYPVTTYFQTALISCRAVLIARLQPNCNPGPFLRSSERRVDGLGVGLVLVFLERG